MMDHSIPYGHQYITDDDIQAVVETLKSDYMTQGPRIDEFEKNFSKYIGCSYSCMVSNGTAALHLCAMALDIRPGDKVITTPITFVASANGFRYLGAEIVFCDIDPRTYLLDLDKLEDILRKSPYGTYKAVVPVDRADLEALEILVAVHERALDALEEPRVVVERTGDLQTRRVAVDEVRDRAELGAGHPVLDPVEAAGLQAEHVAARAADQPEVETVNVTALAEENREAQAVNVPALERDLKRRSQAEFQRRPRNLLIDGRLGRLTLFGAESRRRED